LNNKTTYGSKIHVHGLMLLAIILAASSFPVGAIIANELPPAVLMFIRFLLAALLLLPLVTHKYGIKIPELKLLLRYAALSAPLAVFFWCMFESLRYTSVVNTGALYTLVPAFTAISTYFINKEITNNFRIFGLLVGTLGALWIVFRGNIDLFIGMDLNYGDVIFIFGCISLSLYNPMIRRLHTGEPMIVLTFWILITGSIWLLLLSLKDISQIDWKHIDNAVYLWIIYLALFTTLITFFIINFSTIKIGATKVAAYGFLTPFFVILISLIVGLEKFEMILLPGIILILGSMLFIQFEMKSKKGHNKTSL
jgi:drug/metabolite transporter (DMT)-like permease